MFGGASRVRSASSHGCRDAVQRHDLSGRIHADQDVIRRVTPVQLAQLLAALPSKQSTRISIARVVGEFVIPEDTEKDAGFVEYRNLCELGGFDVSGPVTVADILARVGAGEYRVSAYGFEPRGLRWEVFVRLGEEAS
jgi:hypothetical protein